MRGAHALQMIFASKSAMHHAASNHAGGSDCARNTSASWRRGKTHQATSDTTDVSGSMTCFPEPSGRVRRVASAAAASHPSCARRRKAKKALERSMSSAAENQEDAMQHSRDARPVATIAVLANTAESYSCEERQEKPRK